jgi:hypothetical protein
MAVSAWVGALGPWVVAGAAIWGERIRAAVLRPKLCLKLASNVGERTEQVMMEGDLVTAVLPARYFHLRVINRRRFPAAHEVQIFMTKLEIPGPDGQQPRTIYSVPLPFTWHYPELYPNPLRTIGYTTVAQASMFFVRPGMLQLTLPLVPTNLSNTFQPNAHFWITAIARGIDGKSNSVRLKVDWDGTWESGDAEMTQHLTITSA